MSTPTRWGILATGGIATKFTTDLKLLPDASAVAVASRSRESADRFAAAHGIARAHASWQAMAEDPDVDIVYVAGPHVAHHAAARLMLDAGKAVLCEKPFTVNAGEAEDLIATARTNKVFLMEAMWMRANPAVRRAASLVADGAIGEVTSIHADFGIQAPQAAGHRLRDPALGGGALLDLGVYPISLTQLILGAPSRVQATAKLTAAGVDEITGVLLSYPGGEHAALTCCISAYGPVTATIGGTRGYIQLPYPFYRAQHLTLRQDGSLRRNDALRQDQALGRDDTDNEERIDLPYEGNGLRFQAEEAGRALGEGLLESPMFPLDDTLAVMRTMDEVRSQIGVRYPGE